MTLGTCFQQLEQVPLLCARKMLGPGVAKNTISAVIDCLGYSFWRKGNEHRLGNDSEVKDYVCFFINALISAKKSAHLFSMICLRPMLVNGETVGKLWRPLLSHLLCFHLAPAPNTQEPGVRVQPENRSATVPCSTSVSVPCHLLTE